MCFFSVPFGADKGGGGSCSLTENVLKSSNPDKCLFTDLGIKMWVLFLQLVWTEILLTLRRYMVCKMKYVNYFLDFRPGQTQWRGVEGVFAQL